MEIETLIEGFRVYNSCKGLSPKTITWYDAFLRHSADFLRQHQHPTVISQLTISHLRAWHPLNNEERTVGRAGSHSKATYCSGRSIVGL